MLSVSQLQKTYTSGVRALNNVSLTIKRGEFVALLGPNGAGKTTFINILIGNTIKSSGSVFIGEKNIETHHLQAKYLIGVVPQETGFDGFFTVGELLRYQAGYYGMHNPEKRIDELLSTLGLLEKKTTNTRMLSGGMRRRLLIAKALMHDPELVILDEPTAGVDIELRQTIYAFLKDLHASGKTIILTTHYLEEAEKLCDRIIVIHNGDKVADEPKKELTRDESLEDVFLHLTHR